MPLSWREKTRVGSRVFSLIGVGAAIARMGRARAAKNEDFMLTVGYVVENAQFGSDGIREGWMYVCKATKEQLPEPKKRKSRKTTKESGDRSREVLVMS